MIWRYFLTLEKKINQPFEILKKLSKGTELVLKGISRPASLRSRRKRISASF